MRHSRQQLKGAFILLMTIGLAALLFTFGLAVVNFTTTHQQLVRKAETIARARESARAGLALSLASLRTDPNWAAGLTNTTVLAGDGLASLTFNSGAALSISIPLSLRNDGPGPLVEPGGRILPAGFVHLICVGRCQTATATEEALVAQSAVLLTQDFLLDLTTTLVGNQTWTDYQADFSALLSVGTGEAFLVRASGSATALTAYLVSFDSLVNPLQGGTFSLSRMVGGSSTVLLQVPRSSTPLGSNLLWSLLQIAHDFKISAIGSQISLTVDGVPIFSYNDNDAAAVANGEVGVAPPLGSLFLLEQVTVTSPFKVITQWRR